jgi:hypothetical protein
MIKKIKDNEKAGNAASMECQVTDGMLKWILKEQHGRMWTGLIWLRIGTSGRLL